jgi:hypothetical protein
LLLLLMLLVGRLACYGILHGRHLTVAASVVASKRHGGGYRIGVDQVSWVFGVAMRMDAF